MTNETEESYRNINVFIIITVKLVLDDVKEWMSTSKLKLNPDKTEFILFCSKIGRIS